MKSGLLLTVAVTAMLIRGNAAQAAQNFVTLKDTDPAAVNTVAVSPDSKYIVAGLDNGMIYVWDYGSGTQLSPPPF